MQGPQTPAGPQALAAAEAAGSGGSIEGATRVARRCRTDRPPAACAVLQPNNTKVLELLQWFAGQFSNLDGKATLLLTSGGTKDQKASINE